MPAYSKPISILLFLLFTACSQNKHPNSDKGQILNLKYNVRDHLRLKSLDRFDQNTFFYSDVVVQFLDYGMNECKCTFNNGLVEIKLSAIYGFVGHELVIQANDSIFNAVYQHRGDIRVEEYLATPIKQNLTLSTNEFEIGKALHGSIDFEGITFTDLLRDITDFKIKLLGNFGCILRKKTDESY